MTVSTTHDTVAGTSNKFKFNRVVTLNSADGERGKTVTVTGKGFQELH